VIDPKKLDEIQEKHDGAVPLTAAGETVVVTTPTRVKWRRFKDAISDDRKKSIAFEILLRDCVVYPDAVGLEAMLERKPGLAETFGAECAELAGAGVEVEKNA
jgi:hypothetical protein